MTGQFYCHLFQLNHRIEECHNSALLEATHTDITLHLVFLIHNFTDFMHTYTHKPKSGVMVEIQHIM